MPCNLCVNCSVDAFESFRTILFQTTSPHFAWHVFITLIMPKCRISGFCYLRESCVRAFGITINTTLIFPITKPFDKEAILFL